MYDSKIDKTKSIISEHNLVAKKKVEFETFLSNLQEAGGTTDEALRACTWEDLERFGLPTLIAKQVAAVFRTREESERKTISEKKTQAMTPKELFEHFDPRNWDNFVGKRLAEIARGQRCLVYAADGSVDAVASAVLVEELRDGFAEREWIERDGKPVKVYRIGERPDQMAFENPLFPGQLLRPDETCSVTQRSWAGIPEVVRVLLYLALKQTTELRFCVNTAAHDLIDLAASQDAEAKIRKRYPRASLLYDSLKNVGNLPTLRLCRNQQKSSNDPFYRHHKCF